MQYTGVTASTDRAFSGTAAGAKFEVTQAGTNLTVGTGAALSGSIIKIGPGTLTLAGTADNGAFSATATAGTLVLGKTSSSTVHTIGGTLTVAGGIAQLGGSGSDQIADTSGVVINSGTFDLNGKNETIATLTGTGGTMTNTNATTATLTYSAFTGTAIYSGTITDGVGKVAITKINGSTMTLNGAGSNAYSGTTAIAARLLGLELHRGFHQSHR